MLSMSDLMIWGKNEGIPFGPSRGSVAGSRCAFVTDIIDVDPARWNLVFSRFCNENRVEIGDIDIDVPDAYRPMIYNHIFESFGREKCAYVLAMESIKYLNKRLSREFYKLRNNKFDSFIDLLLMNQKRKIADSRQLGILIELDFFSEFGNPNQLLEQIDIFNNFLDAKQLNKDEMRKV